MTYSWNDRDSVNAGIVERLRLASENGGLRKKGKAYYLRGEWKPGVTTVIGCLDKSKPLVTWSARVQFEADEETAWGLYGEGLVPGLPRETFKQMFEDRAGKTRQHQKLLQEAADLGGHVHSMIEHHVRSMIGEKARMPTIPDEALYVFEGWEQWAKDTLFLPVATEFPVFSVKHAYAGSPDVLGWALPRIMLGVWKEPRLCLIDWKTANGIYGDHSLQNAAYRHALVEMGVLGEDIDGLLVRLPKKSDEPEPFEEAIVPREDFGRHLEAFVHLRGVYPWKKRDDEEGLARWREKRDRKARVA
jgi:hypothetical protein